MNVFQTISKFVEQIIKSIENTGVASVKSLNDTIKTTTHSVKVVNPQEKVTVSGKVEVTNHDLMEKELQRVIEALRLINKTLPTLKNVRVENQKEFPKFPEFPKRLEISNLKDKTEVTNLSEVTKAVNELEKSLSKLKLNPTIKVDAPVIPAPIVNVPKQPAPVVNVEKNEIDISDITRVADFLEGLDAKKPLPVRLSDGKAFYKAVDRIAEAVSARSVSPFVTANGDETRALVDPQGRLVIVDMAAATDGFGPTDNLVTTNVTVGSINTLTTTNGTLTKTVTIDNSTGTITVNWT